MKLRSVLKFSSLSSCLERKEYVKKIFLDYLMSPINVQPEHCTARECEENQCLVYTVIFGKILIPSHIRDELKDSTSAATSVAKVYQGIFSEMFVFLHSCIQYSNSRSADFQSDNFRCCQYLKRIDLFYSTVFFYYQVFGGRLRASSDPHLTPPPPPPSPSDAIRIP